MKTPNNKKLEKTLVRLMLDLGFDGSESHSEAFATALHSAAEVARAKVKASHKEGCYYYTIPVLAEALRQNTAMSVVCPPRRP